MDIGASSYHGWRQESSAVGTKWFVDRFGRFDLDFDRILMFDYSFRSPQDVYQNVTHDILAKVSFFNVGVSAALDAAFNPWNILKSLAHKKDYVVVKLDIDTPLIENALINQLLHDAEVASLVDEMFYEHHVNVRAMHRYWRTERSRLTLNDSYQTFQRLRVMGIRMHSWP